MDRIMAVLTREPQYAERFCDYVNRKNVISLMAVPFSSPEQCMAYGMKHNIELLVSDLIFAGGGYNAKGCSSDDIRAGKKLYLYGGASGSPGLRESVPEGAGTAGSTDILKKYQSAEKLLDEIIASAGNRDLLRAAASTGRKSKVIGIFSPLGRCGKTSFSLAICRMLSRGHRVLYLNLDEFSDIYDFFGCRASEGISEAIYDLKRGKLDRARIKSLTVRNLDIDWLPPVTNQEDYALITGRDYVSLINEILKESDYEYIIADMDRYNGQADVIMDICDRIFIITIDEGMSSRKSLNFASFMQNTREQSWLERVRYLELPEAKSRSSPCEYLDNLCYGKMGDLIRSLGLED